MRSTLAPLDHRQTQRQRTLRPLVAGHYLRGQDIDRWSAEWAGLWIIFARRGINIDRYPSIKAHLEQYRAELEPKPEGQSDSSRRGRKPGGYQWFEIQDTTEYWKEFDK